MIRYTSKIFNRLNYSLSTTVLYYLTFNKDQQPIRQKPVISTTHAPIQNKNHTKLSLTNQKISPLGLRQAQLTKKLRSSCSIYETYLVIQQNFQEFQKIGQTLVFDYLNLSILQIRGVRSKQLLIQLVQLLNKFQNISLYQLTMKVSLLQKLRPFVLTNPQHKAYINQIIQISVNQILQIFEKSNQKQICVGDVLNILGIFRIQTHQNLLIKSLQLLDRQIADENQNYLKNRKLCMILLNQFKYIQWYDLKKFKNIIHFWTHTFTLSEGFWELSEICEMLETIGYMQLHKVGQKKIPKFIKQATQKLLENKNKLSLRNIVGVIKVTNKLPSDFIAQFKQTMFQKYMEFGQKAYNTVVFPFTAVTLKQMQQVFGVEKQWVKNILWKNLIYYSQLQEMKYIMRGSVLAHIQSIVQIVYNNTNESKAKKQLYNMDSTADMTRIGHLVVYYAYKKDKQKIKKLSSILISGFNKLGFKRSLKQSSFNLFFNYFLALNDQPIVHDLFKEFCQALTSRKQRNKFDNYVKNCLKAIQNFIHFDNKYIQKGIIMMIQQIYSLKNYQKQLDDINIKSKQFQLDKFNFKTDLYIFLYITNRKQELNPQLRQIKQNIIRKISTYEELQTIVEYFLLYGHQNFKGFLQISQLIINSTDLKIDNQSNRNNRILFLLIYLLEGTKLITNKRGRIENNLVTYLNRYEDKIIFGKRGCIDQLHQVNRVLSRIKQHEQVKKFSHKLYTQTLLSLHEQLYKQQFKLQGSSSRTIIQFILKLQHVLDVKAVLSDENIRILEKAYSIFRRVVKLDNGIYVKVKFLEFVCMYKEIINVSSNMELGYAIQLEHLLSNVGNKATNLPEVLLTICKLYCLGLLQLNEEKAVEYHAILLSSIKNNKITLFSLHNIITSILYSAQLFDVKQSNIREKFNNIITPIVVEAFPTCIQINNPIIITNFIEYFKFVKKIQKIYPLVNHLLTLYLTPKTLIHLIQLLPFNTIPKQIMNQLMNKVSDLLYLLDFNSINLIYLLQRIFYINPQQYEKTLEEVWKIANENMYKNTKNLQEKTKNNKISFDQQKFSLGPFLFYMFACIKAQKVQGNVNFSYLLSFVKKNEQKILTIYKNPLYKTLTLCIVLYVNFYGTKLQKLKPTLVNQYKKTIHNIRSKYLQQQLTQKQIKFYFNYEVNNLVVPYYLPEQQEIILNNNMYMKNQLVNKQTKINGYMKFYQEVFRAMYPHCKVRIYDAITNSIL